MNLGNRFWEIDFFRGTAIILMISYHFLFDLDFFGVYPLNISSGFLWFFPRAIAGMFIFLVGISLYLSFSRAKLSGRYVHGREFFFKYFKRGVWIFSLGLLITLTTFTFIPGDFIIFGILHFIGLAIILQYPFLTYNERYKYLNLGSGLIFIALGLYLANLTFDFNWLLWLGFVPNNLQTVDYFPLLPWLGLVSLGIFMGGILYRNYRRQFTIPDLSKLSPTRLFCFFGKHSLLIYFIHQPILILILYILGFINTSYFF